MKNIDITTTQNVTIQYGLASAVYRTIAFLIDLLVISIVSGILLGVISTLSKSAEEIALYFTVIPFVVFYSLAFEQLNNGQSLGKLALRLRVIRADGEKANFLDYVMRWVFRALDIYFTLGGVAVLCVVSSRNNQRIGDLLANTIVVNVGKTERMRLDSLLKLNKIQNYKTTYPEVVNMPEEAMLIVKETLQKHKKHKNFAHQQALNLLVEKIGIELNIVPPKNKTQFLKTLLKDYVVLTR